MLSAIKRESTLKYRIKNLTEAITLQAIEDMCDPEYVNESVDFLRGGGLGMCMEIIDMDYIQKKKLVRLLCLDNAGKED